MSLVALLVAAGCLQPGKPPEGSKLVSGRDIGGISFVSLDDETVPNQKVTWVSFDRRKAPATPTKGAVSDLWLASWDGTQQRLVVADRSSAWGMVGAGGSLFAMVDERQVESGGAGGGQVESVGTLVRIDSHYRPGATLENVSTFTLDRFHDDRLLFRKVPPDDTPGLFLWDGESQLRLGDVASVSLLDVEVADSGTAYFVLGSDRVFSRLGKLTDTKQDLHPNVSRFLLRGDEKYAVLSLSTAGTSTTVVLDLESGKEIPLARPNPCCWFGFANPDLFTYSQSASGGAPAEYHTLDLVSGIDTTLVLPALLVDLASVMSRPYSDEDLYVDSQGHGVFFGHDHQVRRIVQRFDEATQGWVPVPMLGPLFSLDGQYLIYVDPQPTTESDPDPHGPLMVMDSALVNPPRQLSTPGMTVWENKYFFIDGASGARRRGRDPGAQAEDSMFSIQGPSGPILVFWASIVRASADLYFANHVTGELKVVATSIGNVTVDSRQIFGTVNVSAQDETGDLVVDDVQDSGGRTLAHAVTEATSWSGLVGYVVRGRAASDHDGLWGSTMAPPSQDGGQ